MIVKEKVIQAKEILKEFNIDCWITFLRESEINGDPSLDFLSDSDVTWHSAFIITRLGEAIAIVGKYDKQSIVDTGAYDEVIDYVEGIKQPFQKLMRTINPAKIALNYSLSSEICDGLTYGMFLTIKNYLGEIGLGDRIVPAEPIVSALRERKSTSEVENIRIAIHETENIFEKLSEFIKPGITEKEIAAFMKAEAAKKNLGFAWNEATCPSVFTGINKNEAHYGPTNKIVSKGQILNIDFGLRYNGYCSDMQRTFYIRKDNETFPPPDVMRGFTTIVDSIEKAKKGMKPGIPGWKIDEIARSFIVKAGYDEFPHGLGHQVGRFAHDGNALLGPKWEKYADKPFKNLEEGMVFTIEPRLTVEDKGVVTIEEMVIVKHSGTEWLSTPQKDIYLI